MFNAFPHSIHPAVWSLFGPVSLAITMAFYPFASSPSSDDPSKNDVTVATPLLRRSEGRPFQHKDLEALQRMAAGELGPGQLTGAAGVGDFCHDGEEEVRGTGGMKGSGVDMEVMEVWTGWTYL